MIRRKAAEQQLGASEFRWRGGEISRIEGFSDAVFAFAVTLLVVSLEVPTTFEELLAAMRGFFAFAVCFSFLMFLWYNHYVFFRRYGLQDKTTIMLNAVLLFVMLFYVYPLKFLFAGFINDLIGIEAANWRPDEAPLLFIIYGSGFAAVFGVLALLYWYAYHKRDQLDLNALELFETRGSIRVNALTAAVGVVSIVIALLASPAYVGLAGWAYFLLSVVYTANGFMQGAGRRRLEHAKK